MRAFASTTCLALALVVGACSNRPDPTANAEKALNDANLSDVDVKWDDNTQIAHLTGTVDSPMDRQRAEQIATSAVGTTGKVLNEVTVKGMNDRTADDLDGQIRRSLNDKVDVDPVLKDRDINFDVANGVVTVKGDVRTAEEKARVSEMVKSQSGVKDFANALDVTPGR